MLEFLKSFFPIEMNQEYGKFLKIAFRKLKKMIELDSKDFPNLSLDLLKMFSKRPKMDQKLLYCNVTTVLMANTQTLIDEYKNLESSHEQSLAEIEELNREQ
jgi:hypothetical protein